MREKSSILIVDDNISLCKTLTYILKRKGHTVATAKDGLEAIEKVKENSFDLIFIDIKMPLMNGHKIMNIEPIFFAKIENWPPYNMELKLTNPPIEYYREFDVDREEATPLLMIEENVINFGEKEVSLLKYYPKIIRADLIDSKGNNWKEGDIGGVKITWSETVSKIEDEDPPIACYNIYRNRSLRIDLDKWELIASVSPNQTSIIDKDFDGTVSMNYIVLHAALYNFNYHYESVYGKPFTVNKLD